MFLFVMIISSSWFGQMCCPSYFDQVEMVRLLSVSQWLQSNTFNFSFWLKIWWPSYFDQIKMVKTPLHKHCSQLWCLARKKLGYGITKFFFINFFFLGSLQSSSLWSWFWQWQIGYRVILVFKTKLLMLNPHSTKTWPWLSARTTLIIKDSSLDSLTFICLKCDEKLSTRWSVWENLKASQLISFTSHSDNFLKSVKIQSNWVLLAVHVPAKILFFQKKASFDYQISQCSLICVPFCSFQKQQVSQQSLTVSTLNSLNWSIWMESWVGLFDIW